MKAAQPFSGHHLPKKYFGQRSLRQCATSGKGDNIVLIEVDSDDFGDVIILDVPESFQEKFSKNKEFHVISDDDDDDDDGDDVGSKSRAGEYDMAGDATTSYRFSSAPEVRSSNCPNVVKGGLFVGEGSKPVKLSKSKRTYSGTGFSRNKYGLCSDSESCSSDSDESDFELMEDPFGKLHEQWEKASFKRRHDTSCGYFDSEDKDGPSASNPPVHNSVEKATAKHSEPTSRESTPNNENDGLKFAQENKFSEQESDAMDVDDFFTRNHGNHHGSSHLRNDGTGESNQPVHHSTKPSTTEYSDLPHDNLFFKSSFINDGWNSVSSDSVEMLAEQSKDQGHEAKEADNVFAGGHSDDVTKGATNRDVENDIATFSDGEQSPESAIAASIISSESHSTESNSSDKNDIVMGDVTKGATIRDVETDFATFSGGEQSAERPITAPNNPSDSHSTESKYSHNNDIITDRQKIKETDEYKRAMEEEWAMRQQQFQLQAEEAHRLRNRKRAENMRIKDNERRQRQRLEEVRETRRKDEENLNLKDKLRAQIRSELRKLETMYFDMASLLRALGIHVNGGFHPSSNEVQAAYKRACLRFHPDRLPTTDLRQQVEAEEKFKLISNMKDKLCQNR